MYLSSFIYPRDLYAHSRLYSTYIVLCHRDLKIFAGGPETLYILVYISTLQLSGEAGLSECQSGIDDLSNWAVDEIHDKKR